MWDSGEGIAEDDQARVRPGGDDAVARSVDDRRGLRGHRPDGFGETGVQVGDAHGLAVNLGHVIVPVGVEGVADIVARACHGNPGVHKVVQRRKPSPVRRAGEIRALAVLEVEVAQRQRDDPYPRLLHQLDGRASPLGWLDGEAAAVPAHDRIGKLGPEDGLGHVTQHLGARIAVLVDMQVDPDPVLGGDRELAVDDLREVGDHHREAAEGRGSVLYGNLRDRLRAGLGIKLGAGQGDGLQLDPAAPGLAQFLHEGVAHLRAVGPGVDVGADDAGPVRPGAAHREFRAALEVGPSPEDLVASQHLEGFPEGRASIGGAVPGVGLVEVDVGVHKGREDERVAQVPDRGAGGGLGACGRDRSDGALVDRDVAGDPRLDRIVLLRGKARGKDREGDSGACQVEHGGRWK